jgi:hypothetical protein
MPYVPGMKNLFKFLAWLAGVAIFLLLTAHFTLRHALNTPKFKAALTGFIARSTGRTAEYERIDYSLFPFSLVVRNATLKEQDGGRDFASMKEFSALVDFRAKEITALKLAEPTIRIVQRPDGTFNFSDLMAPPAAEAAPGGTPPGGALAAPGSAPASKAKPATPAIPRFSVRRVQIENARLDFVAMDAAQREETFSLSNVDFLLRDVARDKPVRMDGSATIGQASALQFELSGPALADYAGNPGSWPMAFNGRLDLRDFADVKAFLPQDTLPFQSLEMTWNAHGSLADKLEVLLHLQTPKATKAWPFSVELGLQAELSIPAPVVQHLLAGDPLPEALQFQPLPCELPPGAVALADNPLAALLFKHAQAKIELSFPRIAYGQNLFTDGSATAYLRNGVLTVPRARCLAYGGAVDVRGNAQLLACPLSYRLDRLVAENMDLGQALAANGLGDLVALSGSLHLEASAGGYAVAEPGWRSLAADAKAHIDHLQTVGSGGSLMDQVWLQLDQPLLLKLVPRLKSKMEQARHAATNVTTSRYDEATATLSLRNGVAMLSDARLAMPGYRLDLSGKILPFDDRLDLTARLVASPEETARLTDGKDLSAYLPYEKGGLMIPLSLRGSLQEPKVRPDLDRLLQNALGGTVGAEFAPHLENLSDKDKQRVQEGLQILQGLGTLLQKP